MRFKRQEMQFKRQETKDGVQKQVTRDKNKREKMGESIQDTKDNGWGQDTGYKQ